MSRNILAVRGPNAKPAAKLPGLQTTRVQDPQVQKALDSLREAVEVRLGSRGDPFERAATMRDLEQALAPLKTAIENLQRGMTVATATALPPAQPGSWVQVGEDLYYCPGKVWKKVQLV